MAPRAWIWIGLVENDTFDQILLVIWGTQGCSLALSITPALMLFSLTPHFPSHNQGLSSYHPEFGEEKHSLHLKTTFLPLSAVSPRCFSASIKINLLRPATLISFRSHPRYKFPATNRNGPLVDLLHYPVLLLFLCLSPRQPGSWFLIGSCAQSLINPQSVRKRCLKWEIKVIHILLSGTVMGKQAVSLTFLQSKFMFTNSGSCCEREVYEGLAMCFPPYGCPYVSPLCLRAFSLWHAHMPVFLQLNNIKTNPIYAPFGWVDWVINSWESLPWEAEVLLCE